MAHKTDECMFSQEEQELWALLKANQDKVWHTAKGLEFTYEIVSNEMRINRKKKPLRRIEINRAYHQAKEIQVAKGPKKLTIFGSSYIHPVFLDLGICRLKD